MSTRVQRDYTFTAPIALAIAESIEKSKAQRNKSVPQGVNLAAMITGVEQSLTMQGAPQIQIELLDVGFVLLRSGFWEADVEDAKKGRLDPVEINFPAGSKYWWRIRQVSPKADYVTETFWIPRVVKKLIELHKPIKASRSSRTRAQFLKMLCAKVPEIRFHCKQLDVVQPIADLTLPSASEADTGAKSVGLTEETAKGLTVKGTKITEEQQNVAGTLLRVADRKNAGKVATEALIYAAIYESGLSPKANNGNFWGVLSGSVNTWQQTDTVGMAEAFLEGGKGFQGGGAIALSHKTSNPVQIAVEVEVPSIWPENAYAKQSGYLGNTSALNEVQAIIEAGGGATGTGGIESTTETVEQYNFETGTTDEPEANYWTAMNRLAQEVNWELVVDGPDIYYDSSETLCRNEPEAVIDRTDEAVANWEYDWDDNQIATNFSLEVICEETTRGKQLSFAPPAVVHVTDFGPASQGSTMGLPGRWLVGEVQREPGDIVSTLTLVQPTRALKEPAPTISSSTASGVGGSQVIGDFADSSVLAAVQAAQKLSGYNLPYSERYRTLTKKPPPQGYDCSAGVSWVLLTAGFPLPNGVTWGQWAPVSTNFESWGEPGPGKEMTIWCNSTHMFIEFNVPSFGNTGFDSGHPSSQTAWYGPFIDQTYVASGAFVPRHWKGT